MTDISKEYGAAIFAVACEENEKESYLRSLELIKDTFVSNEAYGEFLSSPAIPLKERLCAIEAAFSDNTPTHVLSYLMLLCEKGRISAFVPSVEEYRALYDASMRITVAKITSATPLSDGEKERLIAKLEATYKGSVSGEYYVDESLLGGVIVEVDGKVMDGSLRHRLREVKEVINT